MKVKKIVLKAYLEGIEIPITSVNIQENVGAAPVAVVNLPAHPAFTKILPKTLIHIFYKGNGIDDDKFYLIFEGELMNMGFSRSHDGTGVQLSFVGLTSNWKYTYKALVDFSLDTLAQGNFYMIGGSSKESRSATEDYLKSKPHGKNESKVYWNFSNIPGTTIVPRLLHTIKKFTDEKDKALDKTIKSLIKDLTDSNPYYRMIHELLKIESRMLVLDNKEVLKTLEGEAALSILTNFFSTLSSLTTGDALLNMILQKMEYFYVEPAAPTKKTDGGPLSILFTPDTTFMMPLRCNIIFPDQIGKSGYNHNFSVEPTRLVASTGVMGLINSATKNTYQMQNKFVAPDGFSWDGVVDSKNGNRSEKIEEKITDSDENDPTATHHDVPSLGMTEDELLRGVQPQVYNYNEAQMSYSAFIRKESPNAAAATKKATEMGSTSNKITKYIKNINLFQFYKRRFNSRNFNITVPYNPNRMVGFPGLVLDYSLPSVVGKIVSINSSIDTNGNSISTITMEGPRYYEANNYQEITDPFETGKFEDYVHVWPNVNFWIDPSKYSASKISETLNEITNPSDKNYKACCDYYAPSGAVASSSDSKDLVKIISSAIFYLLDKSKLYSDPDLFIDKEIKRDLMDEKSFWKFLLGSENADPSDKKYRKSVKNMTYNSKNRLIYNNGEAILKQKNIPFTKEKQDIIKNILEELTNGR